MLDGQFDFPLYDQVKETFGEAKGEMKALDESLILRKRLTARKH